MIEAARWAWWMRGTFSAPSGGVWEAYTGLVRRLKLGRGQRRNRRPRRTASK